MILTTRKIAKIPKNPKHDRRFSNVKLFGKKTLALALALTMVLSLCSFTAMADGTLTITGPSSMVLGGNTVQMNANFPDGATEKAWSSSDTSVATIDNSGVVTAVKGGTTTITASYKPAATAENQSPSTVTSDGLKLTVIVRPTGVTITNKSTVEAGTYYVGNKVSLTTSVQPTDTTNKNIEWSSSNTNIATVENGEVTFKKVSVDTTVIITAAAEDNAAAKDTVTLSVKPDTVQSAVLASGEKNTLDVSYGTSSADVVKQLKNTKIKVTYAHNGEETVTVDDWKCTTSYDPTKLDGSCEFQSELYNNAKVTVTVKAGVVKSSSVSPNQITVSKNTQANAIGLPASATVTLENGYSLDITVGSGDKVDYAWVCSNYNPTVTGAYTFTATRKSGTDPRFTMDAAKAPKVTVTVADYIPVNKATTSMAYTRTNTSVDLSDTIAAAVNAKIRERMGSSYNARTTIESVVLSGSNSYGVMGTGSNKAVFTITKTLPSSGTATQDFTYIALGNDGQKYSGTVTLTIYSGTFDVSDATSTSDPIVYFSGSNGIASKIADAFKARYGSTPTYIEFGSIGRNDDELGELRDGNGDSVEDGTYTFSSKDEDYDSVANIYFVPTGVGGTFEIEYTAYSGSSKRSSSMTGTIAIKCDEMLVVWLNDMGAGETQNLSASAIQEQVTEILDTNKISYTLDTVSLNRPSTGTIYDGNNKKITTKTVDAEDLDDYTYEAPAKVTSANLVTIRFSVKCKPDSGKSSKTASGVMLFNLTKKADITITAPANDAAVLGTDVFQTYFEKNASSTYRKNYDACYVVFSGAPNSNTSGYLYDGYKSGIINGSKIKSPNGKKFALTDISAYDKNAYDLSNTYYVPGSRNCTGGTFEIYGVKSGTTIKSSTRFTKLCEGSIDYVVGSAAAAITGTINASNYMQMTPSAFTKSNKNASYVVFTAQPAGGKLVYNYNRTTPGVVKEISLNTPYYITYSAANANYYLGYVSFVPAYTAVKGVTSVVDIPCTIYSTSKVGTACSVKISVVSATKSAKFTDVGVAYMPYADSIDFLYNCGITTGTSTTGSLYNPSGSVTRGEWITMLYRAAGSPKMSNKIPFTDVTAKNSYSWCYDAVRWAYQNNICQGTGATTFSPAMKLDRQQIVTFMYNYAVKYNGGNGAGSSINGYTDSASVASWAKAPMEWAVKNQYYTVVGTRLQPTDSANRAEVALYMHRLLTY